MKNYILAAVCLLGLTACAGMKSFMADDDKGRIEARPNGLYASVATASDKADAEKYSLNTAKSFCKKKGKEAIVTTTKNNYSGLTSEKGDKTLKKLGNVAMLTGVSGKAALASDEMTDDAMYEVQMEFKCE